MCSTGAAVYMFALFPCGWSLAWTAGRGADGGCLYVSAIWCMVRASQLWAPLRPLPVLTVGNRGVPWCPSAGSGFWAVPQAAGSRRRP